MNTVNRVTGNLIFWVNKYISDWSTFGNAYGTKLTRSPTILSLSLKLRFANVTLYWEVYIFNRKFYTI